ncbi:MAG: hypothetical protein M3Y05_01805 [Gemmatimonadota bacterium]|nr:hypothetical protein [Gemmatimonadota bacterium]
MTKTRETIFTLMLAVPIAAVVFTRPGDFGQHISRALLLFSAPMVVYYLVEAAIAYRAGNKPTALLLHAAMFAGLAWFGATMPINHYLGLVGILIALVATWTLREKPQMT